MESEHYLRINYTRADSWKAGVLRAPLMSRRPPPPVRALNSSILLTGVYRARGSSDARRLALRSELWMQLQPGHDFSNFCSVVRIKHSLGLISVVWKTDIVRGAHPPIAIGSHFQLKPDQAHIAGHAHITTADKFSGRRVACRCICRPRSEKGKQTRKQYTRHRPPTRN